MVVSFIPTLSISMCSGPWAQGLGPLDPGVHLIPSARWEFAFSFIVVLFAVSLITTFCYLTHSSFLLSHSFQHCLFASVLGPGPTALWPRGPCNIIRSLGIYVLVLYLFAFSFIVFCCCLSRSNFLLSHPFQLLAVSLIPTFPVFWVQGLGPWDPGVHLIPSAHWGFSLSFFIILRSH